MKVVFRTDASLQIGTGHVMRCLTLAHELRDKGAVCHFICREHPGNLIGLIRTRGFVVTALPGGATDFWPALAAPVAYAHWLGCDWQIDAEQTLEFVKAIVPDWLVVDHYAIDSQWEEVLRPQTRRMMVIDDLADRKHVCDLLLDQNLGREAEDYSSKVPAACMLLAGPPYALLRPEFAELRTYSLRRRQHPQVKNLLVTMGGVDSYNATSLVLEALRNSALPEDCRITVVMGPHAPWLLRVRKLAASMPWPTSVRVGVENMAQLMADSDLAIGAAGGTSWERCCLGLPTLVVVLAENQRLGAQALKRTAAAILIGEIDDIEIQLPRMFETTIQDEILAQMSKAASEITDGRGLEKLSDLLRAHND
ncbi:MAG: UDP-2,4-diacetamido-2,4,6-trideoxy-beta-L-altropyranose hydrolase [Candidatus Saccharibacteria bacterium]|nr:UDP-2,4-diacetamido-2,4,6-trideoxy-beta-L-altropyranose hydrolase [Rhodoferax sp.]